MTDLGLHHIGRHLIGLKRLNLLSSWRITDAGILSLVHSLTELEYLNLSSCKEATNSGLTEITDKCKAEVVGRNRLYCYYRKECE